MIAQAQSWQVPTLWYAAPHFGVALLFSLFTLTLPTMIRSASIQTRENTYFRVFVITLWIGSCAFAGKALTEGLYKLATG